MKKITTIFVLFALLALSVSVAGATPASYNTGFQVANLSGSVANVSMEFYGAAGTVVATVTDTIAANGSNTYFPLDNPGSVNLPAGFAGSAVISSDQPVAAIVNVIGDNFTAGASAASFSGGATTVSLPLIAKGQVGIYDTWFHVQNTGTATANVTVAYAGTACTETANIAPGAAAKFDQASNTCLPNDHVGAATITSNEPVVATLLETTRDNSGLFAYNGFTSSSAEVSVPLVQFNNVGFHSGIQIQNVGAASTEVTVTYAPAGGLGTACTETGTVAAGSSGTFGLFAFSLNGGTNTDNCTFGQRFVGAATVTSSPSQPLVAIINQTNFSNFASAYGGFNPASATDSLAMPLLMDRNFGYYTGFNLLNAGDATTTVTCTYSTATNGGTIANGSYTLAAGEAVNQLQLNQASQATYVGGGTCTSSNGEPIIAVVNELGVGTTVDLLFTYEAVNK